MSETFQRTQIERCDKSIGEFKQLPSSLDRLKELWNGLILDIIHKDYILLYHCDSEHFPLNTREKQAFLILYYVTYIRIGNALFHLSSLLILPSSSCSFMHICFELWLTHNGISRKVLYEHDLLISSNIDLATIIYHIQADGIALL